VLKWPRYYGSNGWVVTSSDGFYVGKGLLLF
jgi:hypothetical protein